MFSNFFFRIFRVGFGVPSDRFNCMSPPIHYCMEFIQIYSDTKQTWI